MTLDWIPTEQEEREASSFLAGELMILCLSLTAIATTTLVVLAAWFGLGA